MGNKHSKQDKHRITYKLETQPSLIKYTWTQAHTKALDLVLREFRISHLCAVIESYIDRDRVVLDENGNVIYFAYYIRKLERNASAYISEANLREMESSSKMIMVCGREGSGKSAFVLKYLQNLFIADYDPCIEDYYRKLVLIQGIRFQLDLFDQACSEPPSWHWYDKNKSDGWQNSLEYYNSERFFIYMIMFALDNKQSLTEALYIIYNLVTYRQYIKDEQPICIILVCNKCDLRKENVSDSECDTDYGFWDWTGNYGLKHVDVNKGLQIAMQLNLPYFEISNKECHVNEIHRIVEYSIMHYFYLLANQGRFDWTEVATKCYELLGLENVTKHGYES